MNTSMNKAVVVAALVCMNLAWIASAQNVSKRQHTNKDLEKMHSEIRKNYEGHGIPEELIEQMVHNDIATRLAAEGRGPQSHADKLRGEFIAAGVAEDQLEIVLQAALEAKNAPERSPLATAKKQYGQMIERLQSERIHGFLFYQTSAEHFDSKAKPLEARAAKAAAAREKKEIEEKTPVELQWEWYMHLAAALHAASKSRILLQKAEYQNPILPPLDTGNAAEIFEMAVSDFKILLKNPPKRKRAKPGKNSARKPATGRRN
jgi:hypothetical protein